MSHFDRRNRGKLCASVALACLLALVAGTIVLAGPGTAQEAPDPALVPAADPQIPRRRPPVKFSGKAEPVDGSHWLIDGRMVLIAEPVNSGAQVVVTGVRDKVGSLRAEHVLMIAPEGPQGYTLEFRGLIQEITPRYWVVSRRYVFITESTAVEGKPVLGALAEVKGTRVYEDLVLARSVRVVVPGAFDEVEFEGSVDSVDNALWIVGGVAVTISPVTTVLGTPALGLSAEVQGIFQPGGSVLAMRVTLRGAGVAQVDVEGTVQSIEAGRWVVDDRSFYTDSQTFVDDSRAAAEIGAWAQVRAVRRRDRSLLAIRIRLLRPR